LGGMRAAGRHLLTVVVAGTLGASAQAQQNPGLSVQPSGRSLDGTASAAAEQLPDLSRPETQSHELISRPAADSLRETLQEAADNGKAWAQTRLAQTYLEPPKTRERIQTAIALLRRAAEQNDAEALYLLAKMSAEGLGVKPSDVDAFAQMQRAADLGLADAQFALGTMYFEGRGTAQNEAAAVEEFRRAAAGGHREAMFAGGRILLSKTDPETRAAGLALMNRAIENGHIEATLMLATAYGRGSLGMPKDEAKAEALLKPGAERGNAECQMTLASLYKFGDTFGARREEAQLWLQRAADQGHPRALEILQAEEMERPAGPAGPTE
jgi:uncharacterized protein